MAERHRHVLNRAAAVACALAASAAAPLARADGADGAEASAAADAPEAVSADGPAAAADKSVVVWPVLTPAGDDAFGAAVHKPGPSEGSIYARAMELDATLRDAVQDLGYTLDIADPGPDGWGGGSGWGGLGGRGVRARDIDMLERAQHSTASASSPADGGTWVVSPRLEQASGDSFLLRIVVVPPKGKQLRVRVERVPAADVSVRGLVLLRDLLASTPPSSTSEPRPQESAAAGIMGPLHSPGRAVLAANAALFGAFMAFGVQRASGSDDPRLLYPLLTLGTGLGLGSALLVAQEWNVSTGDAWTLAGGAWWGVASGVLIANGQRGTPLTDRYAWGVGGGLLGLGLATFSLTRHKADEGDAVLVHSGAGLGLGLGALTDYFYHGSLDSAPHTGAGFGSAAGLLAGGALAMFTDLSASRVLLVDLGAGLGAAAGAAIGSPLVFENLTPEKTRGFVAATLGGTLVGGATAWWLTRDRAPAAAAQSAVRVTPYGGTVGASATPRGAVPAYGLGVRGTF